MNWREAKVALAKQAPTESSKAGVTPIPPTAPKAKGEETSGEQEILGPDWNHVVRGGCVVKAAIPPPPNPAPDPVTESPRTEATTTRKVKTAKLAPKVTVGPEQAAVPKTMKSAKPRQPSQRSPKKLVTATQPNQLPIDEISYLLDNVPLKACGELTRRLLTSVPTLPSGPARSRAVLKVVVLFVSEYGSKA